MAGETVEWRPAPERVREKLKGSDRPYVTLKAAISLDGKIATAKGESQWITGEDARQAGQHLRAHHDAVLVGINTVLADNPRLTVRLPGGLLPGRRQPARVVLDSGCRIAPQSHCLADDGARRVVVVGARADAARVGVLREAGVEVIACGDPRPRPEEFLPALRRAGLATVFVEGGGQVIANLIAHGEADELFLFVAGIMIGGEGPRDWCAGLGVDRLEKAPRLALSPPRLVGKDVILHGLFVPQTAQP